LSAILGVSDIHTEAVSDSYVRSVTYPTYKSDKGIRCLNTTCVSNQETAYIVPEFSIVSEKPDVLRCIYCHQETGPKAAGSLRTKVYHKAGLYTTRRVHDNNLVYFDSYEQASSLGFRPDNRVKG